MVARSDLAALIATASKGRLSDLDDGNGWPVRATLNVEHRKIPVALYVGPIGASHRKRADERRFQNPGQNRPIHDVASGLPLLFGVSQEPHTKAPIVVAFDAYRRLDLKTRFSMFLPFDLLSEAADEGHAEHESTAGEMLQAFPLEQVAEYLDSLVDPIVPTLRQPREDTSSIASDAADSRTLHIRPKVGMYAAFARLNYKPWFALAEFVDNSVQSFLNHRAELGNDALQVHIRLDEDQIRIADKAGGIAWKDFPRAFSPSQPPPNAEGLSEFGLGMKAAACWFSNNWSVRTSALGDPHEREVHFDVDRITTEGIEHLAVESRPAKAASHYTIVTLANLRVRPRARTIGKIKAHLSSIYRVLIEKGVVKIEWESSGKKSELEFKQRAILRAPYFRAPTEDPKLWKKPIQIQLDETRSVSGWVALLEKGSVSKAGLSIFRRDRLIQGSDDETYRPLSIFRSPNSYTYQRLIGELHVEGFDVSHTKDGIQWGGLEQDLLMRLKQEVNSGDTPLLSQAEGYRVRQRASDLDSGFGAEALQGAGAELSQQDLTQVLHQGEGVEEPEEAPPDISFDDAGAALKPRSLEEFQTIVRVLDEPWKLNLRLISDPAEDWYGVNDTSGAETSFDVWINLGHSFSEAYVNGDENTMGPLIRLVAALALSEQAALRGGLARATMIRHGVNDILRTEFKSNEGQT